MRKRKPTTIYPPADLWNRLEAWAMDLGQRTGMAHYPSQLAVRAMKQSVDRWDRKKSRLQKPATT